MLSKAHVFTVCYTVYWNVRAPYVTLLTVLSALLCPRCFHIRYMTNIRQRQKQNLTANVI